MDYYIMGLGTCWEETLAHLDPALTHFMGLISFLGDLK